MTRALVVYGDKQIGNAIADGLTARELAVVREELRKVKARDGVRQYGDDVRWQDVSGALAAKYSTRTHGRLYGAVLGAWALVWLAIFGAFGYLQAWNRS